MTTKRPLALALACCLQLVLLCSPGSGARADDGSPIVSLSIEGLVRVDRAGVEKALPFKVGAQWSDDAATEGVRAVYRLGAFSRVAIDGAPSGDGVAVTVRVVEYPVVRSVGIEGNSAVTTEDLKKVLTLKAYGFFDPADYPAQVELIRKAYEAKGYQDIRVTPRAEPGANGVRVVFAIEEGRKDLISEIDILGNRALTDREVRGAMGTSEGGPLSFISDSGVLEHEKLALDLERIRMLYWDRGYLDVQVEEPVIRRSADGSGLYVGIRVVEGGEIRAGKIGFSGEWPSLPEAESLQTIRAGDVLERSRLLATMKALEGSVRDRGYARARVTPRTTPSGETGVLDLDFALSRGPLVRVRRIDIVGNHKARDYVIRQEMRLLEGDLYSQKRLDDSIRYVRALGFFDSVDVKPVPVEGDEGRTDLLVTVAEGSSGSLTFALGFSNQDGLTGSLQYAQRNLFGRGQRLNLSVEKGGKTTSYSASFTEPRVFMSDWSMGVDLFDTLKEYSTYKEGRRGGGVRFGYRLSDLASVNLRYRYTSFDVMDVNPAASDFIQKQAGRNSTSAVRAGFMLDTRDYPLDPRNGWSLELSQEAAGGVLGGTNGFLRTQVEASAFTPLAGDFIGSAHLVAGAIAPIEGLAIPVTERYFMGGMGSLRGFEYRKVGPLDEDGQPLGGVKEVQFTLEATYPLVKEPNIKGVLFFDAGNVWGEGEQVDLGGLRCGAGLGFRWLSPMGPLRLEWGTNLDPKPGERQPGWEFTIGTSF